MRVSASNSAGETAGELRANDFDGTTTFSNGHNVFGSDVQGNVPGDRENISAGALFAALEYGGGKLGPDGTVALKNSLTNPALSVGDPLAATVLDQRGAARPQPAGSLPDLGAVELNQPLSIGATANNDVRSGTNAANNLTGVAGNDYLKAWAATTRWTAVTAATCSMADRATTSSPAARALIWSPTLDAVTGLRRR